MSQRVFNDSCNREQVVSSDVIDKSDEVFWIEKAGLPILIIVGTLGNFLNIFIMAGEKRKVQSVHLVSKSTKVFLLAMAMSDIILLWFQVPTYVQVYVQGLTFFDNSTKALGFKQFQGFQQWGSQAFIQWSDWILIAFSIDRLKAFHHIARSFRMSTTVPPPPESIAKPKELNRLGARESVVLKITASSSDGATRAGFSRSTAIALVVILLVGALIFSMENGVYYFYRIYNDPGERKPFYTWRPDWLTDWNFYQMICEVAMTVAKFVVLLVVNIHLIVIVISQRRGGAGSPDMTAAQRNRRQKSSKEKTGTNLLIGCLLVYFFTHFPYVVFQCLRLAAAPPYCVVFMPFDSFMMARPIITMVLYSNYSVNFLLYFALSRKFRDEFRLLRQRWKQALKRLSMTLSGCCCRSRRGSSPVHRTRLSTLVSTSSSGTTVTVADISL
ncbi:hypothetical protein BV898_04458 [Hypsibius exemplaris]|uniref:G-protein coupled receptors family 1 profile domain-containing protein n=1 Tax=Hypsibius exemplaris TaxID=2072580 RepID=A0A1W0X259_HYPEX|nr:hypothetical protein BV898_04458 [Hypsibius exemplaris]